MFFKKIEPLGHAQHDPKVTCTLWLSRSQERYDNMNPFFCDFFFFFSDVHFPIVSIKITKPRENLIKSGPAECRISLLQSDDRCILNPLWQWSRKMKGKTYLWC